MNNLMHMTDSQRDMIRKQCLRSFYDFCIGVMGYDDIASLHQEYCRFLEQDYSRKQVTMPRSFVKTWIGSIAYPIWITLPREEADEFPEGVDTESKFWQLGPDMRILIASYVISNAEKMISLIRKTYESNQAMQILFPEVIPTNFNKVKWNNQSACINRPTDATESTFEAAGIGGASTSRHYDLIIEDDLIYAKKDDFSGRELQPSQEDIDKAIGWHKLATSLLVPGKHTRIHNTGTRWAKQDLIRYIWDNEKIYKTFIRGVVNLDELKEHNGDWEKCTPEWGEMYDLEQLRLIAQAQGPYMFATQYLLQPSAPEDKLFNPAWLQYYKTRADLPKNMRIFTTVDLASWGTKKKSTDCNTVVTTCGFDEAGHMWVLHYKAGRMDPTETIIEMARHQKAFNPEQIGVEEVYYQKALGHFARKAMQLGFTLDTKGEKVAIPFMKIVALKPESNESKTLRIMALEPIAANMGLHIRPEFNELIEEFTDYIPNSELCKRDILDTLAYQVKLARPATVLETRKERKSDLVVTTGTIDEWLEKKWAEKKPTDCFGNRTVQKSIEEDVYDINTLSHLIDPFTDIF